MNEVRFELAVRVIGSALLAWHVTFGGSAMLSGEVNQQADLAESFRPKVSTLSALGLVFTFGNTQPNSRFIPPTVCNKTNSRTVFVVVFGLKMSRLNVVKYNYIIRFYQHAAIRISVYAARA